VLRRLDAERSFAALILDMDGLMLDTEVVEFRAWQRAAEDFGWSISGEQYAQLLGRTARDGWAVMTAWWEERPSSRGSLTAIQDRAADYAGAETVAVKKGLFALLDWVQREKVPVAVASSSPHATVTARLREAGADKAVDVIVGGDDVAHGKPAPDIFLAAARRLGCEPRECVVVEDSDSGITAAAAAGMTPFLVPDSSMPRVIPAAVRAQAYRICESLAEVLDILSAAPVALVIGRERPHSAPFVGLPKRP
jgi:beta-phosphoglucomutase-like phosphatase (HAD superfamily)